VITSIVAIATVVSSVIFSTINYRQSIRQFTASSRASQFNTIVSGLDSSAGAVQVDSMWLLREFVEDRSNYSSAQAQQDGARDAIQTLAVFIEDKSLNLHQSGLSYYASPIPIIVSRAMDQLKALEDDPSLGSHTADVSHGNFHGISLPGFHPAGSFLAVNTDFRRASLANLNLTAETNDSLAYSFFTCADLTNARFGTADVQAADFTGANLSGADLSHVKHLRRRQLIGVRTNARTQFPKRLRHYHARVTWGASSSACDELVDRMTGMVGGQGYVPSLPCPTTPASVRRLNTDPPFTGRPSDLAEACAMRQL
jgi:hypothetical protein